jgi:2-polyprenyl-3-methyl-5-hydroxy-6-metoxy-1,4-benzoquinol methylase
MKKNIKTWSTPVQREEKSNVPCPICQSTIFKNRLICDGFTYVECMHCGLVQMNPQPLVNEVQQRYVNRFAADYLAYELANEQQFLHLQNLALKDAGFFSIEQQVFKSRLQKGTHFEKPTILDVGCATGALLAQFKKRGWKCSGIELCVPAVEYATKERGLNIHRGTIENAPFSEASFDVILASHLIEHLNNPRNFVHRAYCLLKPGGYLFITTPNIDGFQARLLQELWRSAIFDHLYLFSKKTLSSLLEREGFVIETICTWGGLAQGLAPQILKNIMDYLVKLLNSGDVMIVRARKPFTNNVKSSLD